MSGANRGYADWSMSVRAVEAYEDSEMPKSKWTKDAMLAAIHDVADDLDGMSDDAWNYIASLTRDELFRRFFYASSWHHTSKMFNQTDFYSVSEETVAEFIERPTQRVYSYVLRRGLVTGKLHEFSTYGKAANDLKKRGFRADGCFEGRFDNLPQRRDGLTPLAWTYITWKDVPLEF